MPEKAIGEAVLDPIIKTIEVPCSQRLAFGVFIEEMHTWWPLGKFSVSAMSGHTAQTLRVDSSPGGEIVEIGHDGQEHLWGTIKAYDPYDSFSMDFHIPQPNETPHVFSLVEVEFTALSEETTQVKLTQSNWEAFGERAKSLQGGYGGGWALIFEQAFKAACGG